MKAAVLAFASGVVFAAGLGLSGMTLPAKVTGFLDVAGDWDPSLALVMVGAISVHLVLLRVILRRASPLGGGVFELPSRGAIDARLLTGAALFGVGWGLAGYCPGPALASLVPRALPAAAFVIAMSAGMALQRLTEPLFRRTSTRCEAADATRQPSQ